MTPHIDRVQRRPLTTQEAAAQRTREARAERHEAEQGRARRGGAGLHDVARRQAEARAAELDEFVEVLGRVADERVDEDPRLVARRRTTENADQFADAVDLGPRTGAQLAADLFGDDTTTDKETGR